ncbi:MAG: hypothetical protein ABL877_10675 [Thiobacillus sp.]
MKAALLLATSLMLALSACSADQPAGAPAATTKKVEPPPPPPFAGDGIVCPQDVKQCADGSFVARTGPKCEFVACPEDKK